MKIEHHQKEWPVQQRFQLQPRDKSVHSHDVLLVGHCDDCERCNVDPVIMAVYSISHFGLKTVTYPVGKQLNEWWQTRTLIHKMTLGKPVESKNMKACAIVGDMTLLMSSPADSQLHRKLKLYGASK